MADSHLEKNPDTLQRRLGFKEAVSLVIGTVIGTGVFLKAAVMAQLAGSPLWVMLAWVVAGVLSLCGALCIAELGARFPRAGGEYVYLREAYGPGLAFLYGWMRFWIGSTGSIAAYAVGAATFLTAAVKLPSFFTIAIVSVILIILFSALNCLSVVFGGRVQSFLTGLKILMIASLTLLLLFFAGAFSESFSHLSHGLGTGASWHNLELNLD